MMSRGQVGRSRSKATARIITAGGGGPNQPIVLMASTCVWTADGLGSEGWGWTLTPVMITPHWCRMLDGDARTIRRIADQDLETWRDGRNPNARAVVLSDVGQNLAAHEVLQGDAYDDPTLFQNVIVNGSDGDGTCHDGLGRQVIGARYLVSWFDRAIWKNQEHLGRPPMGLYGVPYVEDRIVVSCTADPERTEFGVPDDGGLTWEQVGRAAASTEALVRRPGIGDGDALAGVTADETVAIALMLQLWTADWFAPSASRGPVQSRYRGVA